MVQNCFFFQFCSKETKDKSKRNRSSKQDSSSSETSSSAESIDDDSSSSDEEKTWRKIHRIKSGSSVNQHQSSKNTRLTISKPAVSYKQANKHKCHDSGSEENFDKTSHRPWHRAVQQKECDVESRNKSGLKQLSEYSKQTSGRERSEANDLDDDDEYDSSDEEKGVKHRLGSVVVSKVQSAQPITLAGRRLPRSNSESGKEQNEPVERLKKLHRSPFTTGTKSSLSVHKDSESNTEEDLIGLVCFNIAIKHFVFQKICEDLYNF